MKKILASLVFSCLTMFGWAQSEVFNIDDTPDFGGCDAIMHDDNGGLVPYSPDANNEILICSGDFIEPVNLFFIGFSLAPGDSLSIYDGFDTTAPPIGTFGGDSLLFETISSSGACLYVVFVANGDAEVGDFSAKILCGTPCDFPIADIDAESDTIKICPGESVQFDASESILENTELGSFTWDFGNGTTNSTDWPIVNYTFNESGGYRIRLSITDSSECSSENIPEIVVLVSTPYEFNLTATDNIICLGNSVLVGTESFVDSTEVGFSEELQNGNTVTWIENNNLVFDNGIYIPDNQGCLETEIVFTQFGNASIDDVNDLSSIFFNMEHSFVGDITIRITCPTGETMSIFPEAGGSGTFLGEPIDDTVPNNPGVGFDYSFSPNSTGGTWMEYLAGGAGITIPAGDYEPEGSFSDLIGCPLNGTWTLEVCDIVGADDGYVFEFGIQFAPQFYPEILQFTPVVENSCAGSYWVNPSLFSEIGPDCDWAVFEPTAAGIFTLEYEVVNDFGCTYTDDIIVTVVPEPNVTVSDVDVCTDEPELVAVIQNAVAGAPYAYAWTPATGLNSTVVASPDILDLDTETAYSVTVTLIGLDNCQGTAQANVTATPFQVTANDVVLCLGETETLGATISGFNPSANYAYSWSPASGLSNSTVPNPTITGLGVDGEYTVTVIKDGFTLCQGTDSFDVIVPPALILTPSPQYNCEATFPDTLNCSPQISNSISYSWSRIIFPSNDTITIAGISADTLFLDDDNNNYRDGHYLLTIKDNVCGTTDSIDFFVAPPLVLGDLQLDPCTEVLPVDIGIELQSQDVTITWDYFNLDEYATGITDSIGFYGDFYSYTTGLPGYYVVNIQQDYCLESGRVVIDFRPEYCELIIPNIMTPNGDGENDTFNVTSIGRFAGSTCQIFNRWGNLVFEDNDYDGTWRAIDISDGVYYYVIGVKRSSGIEYHSGDLTILR